MGVPSALTLGALVSGLSAVRFAAESHFAASISCVILAAVLDGLDGHVARYLGACTPLGFELDSLCDCANFGVVPALVVYFWAKTLPSTDCRFSPDCIVEHRLLWAGCCCYGACCALRLARFNVAGHKEQMDMAHLPAEKRRPSVPKAVQHNFLQRKMYFKGVPAPVGAAYALTPMMLHYSEVSKLLGGVGEHGAWAMGRTGTAMALVATAVLMISPLPTLSSKMFKISAQDSLLQSRHIVLTCFKVGTVLALGYCFYHYPFDVVLVLTVSHVMSIPLGVCIYALLAKSKEA